MRDRALRDHTYELRARELSSVLLDGLSKPALVVESLTGAVA